MDIPYSNTLIYLDNNDSSFMGWYSLFMFGVVYGLEWYNKRHIKKTYHNLQKACNTR